MTLVAGLVHFTAPLSPQNLPISSGLSRHLAPPAKQHARHPFLKFRRVERALPVHVMPPGRVGGNRDGEGGSLDAPGHLHREGDGSLPQVVSLDSLGRVRRVVLAEDTRLAAR